MHIVITGHTKGLGQSLLKHFESMGHTVQGFSYSTGFDINVAEHREKIIEAAETADIFVNNAWGEDHADLDNIKDGQTVLLQKMIERWKGNKNKKLLNISSKACFNHKEHSVLMKKYGEIKRTQNEMINDRIWQYGPHILNVILGCTDTALSVPFIGSKIDPDVVSKSIVDMLLCETMYFQSVTIDATELNYQRKTT